MIITATAKSYSTFIFLFKTKFISGTFEGIRLLKLLKLRLLLLSCYITIKRNNFHIDVNYKFISEVGVSQFNKLNSDKKYEKLLK